MKRVLTFRNHSDPFARLLSGNGALPNRTLRQRFRVGLGLQQARDDARLEESNLYRAPLAANVLGEPLKQGAALDAVHITDQRLAGTREVEGPIGAFREFDSWRTLRIFHARNM